MELLLLGEESNRWKLFVVATALGFGVHTTATVCCAISQKLCQSAGVLCGSSTESEEESNGLKLLWAEHGCYLYTADVVVCPLTVDNSHNSCNCGKNMINPCHWWLYGIQQRRQIKVLLSFIYKRKHWKL